MVTALISQRSRSQCSPRFPSFLLLSLLSQPSHAVRLPPVVALRPPPSGGAVLRTLRDRNISAHISCGRLRGACVAVTVQSSRQAIWISNTTRRFYRRLVSVATILCTMVACSMSVDHPSLLLAQPPPPPVFLTQLVLLSCLPEFYVSNPRCYVLTL